MTRALRRRLLVLNVSVFAVSWWIGTFGSSMVKLHGKSYCVWSVSIPFTYRFIVLPPFGILILVLTMVTSAVGLFFILVTTNE
jgi:hypothetical protein